MQTRSGIRSLLPGSIIQDFMFSPCGYSMNGILDDAYWTIHITPESHCSYASFETNLRGESYNALVKAVLDIFRPQVRRRRGLTRGWPPRSPFAPPPPCVCVVSASR